MKVTRSMFQFEIPKRSPNCSVCQQSFLAGASYYSFLFQEEKKLWTRQDFCVLCGEKFADGEKHKGLSGWYWKSQVSDKPKAAAPVDRVDKAFEILHEVLNKDSLEAQEEAYVLSLYLMRQKKLILRKETTLPGGEIVYIYEIRDTEEMVSVPKLDLSNLQIEKIKCSLTVKLNS